MRTFLIVLAALLQATAAAAQQPVAAPSPPSIVRGRVVDDTTAAPIVRARISVVAGAANAAPAFTDAEGRFSAAVPAIGGIRLRVVKSGFITRDVSVRTSGESIDVILTRGAAVTGRVLGDSGEPLAGSTVRIWPAGTPLSRTATAEGTTDDLGEFRLAGFPAGRYAVSAANQPLSCLGAAAGTYLLQCLQAKAENEIELRSGEEGSVLLLIPSPVDRTLERPPASTITATVNVDGTISSFRVGAAPNVGIRGSVRGRVLANGSPAQGLTVVLSASATAAPDERRLSASAVTDSEGRFAVERMPAGAFRLTVSRSSMVLTSSILGSPGSIITIGEGEQRNGVDVSIVQHGVISGAVVDEAGEPMEGLVIRALRARYVNGRMVLDAVPTLRPRHTDDRGQYRLFGLAPGSYYVVATQPAAPIVEGGPPLHASLQVFYPGRAAAAESVPIRVDAAAAVTNVDMVFAPYRGGRITGRAQLSSGRPVSGTAVLAGSSRSGAIAPEPRAATIRDGQFEFAHVPPGEYVVQVMGARTWESSEEFGTGYISVSSEESTPFDITTAPPSTLSGTIRLEGAGSAVSTASFRMRTLPADPDLSPALPSAEPALSERIELGTDGSFTIAGLVGSRRIITSAPPGWWLKSAVVDGVDLAVDPFIFGVGASRRAGIDVVFADGAGTIAGFVTGSRGEPVAGYPVVVFPTDPAQAYPQSPYLKLTYSDREGRYSVPNLPPGQYSIAAVDAVVDGDDWQHPDALGRLAGIARQIALGRGERATVALRPASVR